MPCKYKCCLRTFIPLELSFAQTIHKFQGLQAGPVDTGKTPNVFQTIIFDLDSKAAETRATGLLYTAVSRATALGDDNGLNSAIYFNGNNLTHEQVVRINYKTNSNVQLANVQCSTQWLCHLNANIIEMKESNLHELQKIIQWTCNTIPYDILYTHSQNYINTSKNPN